MLLKSVDNFFPPSRFRFIKEEITRLWHFLQFAPRVYFTQGGGWPALCFPTFNGVKVAGAETGFPVGGGANSWGGAPTYKLAGFSQKLHEILKILVCRGAGTGGTTPWILHWVVLYNIDVTGMCSVAKCKQSCLIDYLLQLTVVNCNAFRWSVYHKTLRETKWQLYF